MMDFKNHKKKFLLIVFLGLAVYLSFLKIYFIKSDIAKADVTLGPIPQCPYGGGGCISQSFLIGDYQVPFLREASSFGDYQTVCGGSYGYGCGLQENPNFNANAVNLVIKTISYPGFDLQLPIGFSIDNANLVTNPNSSSACYTPELVGTKCTQFSFSGSDWHTMDYVYNVTCSVATMGGGGEVSGNINVPQLGRISGACPESTSQGGSIVPSFAFDFYASPLSMEIEQGQSTTFDTWGHSSRYNNVEYPFYTDLFILYFNIPHASYTFSKATLTYNGNDQDSDHSILTINTTVDTPPGEYPITVCAKNKDHCQNLTLYVTSSASRMVCDSKWHSVPGQSQISTSGFNPVVSLGPSRRAYFIFAYTDANSNDFNYQKCTVGGSNYCSWLGWVKDAMQAYTTNEFGQGFNFSLYASDPPGLSGSYAYVRGSTDNWLDEYGNPTYKDNIILSTDLNSISPSWSVVNNNPVPFGEPTSAPFGDYKVLTRRETDPSVGPDGSVSYCCVLTSSNPPYLNVDLPTDNQNLAGTTTLAGWAIDNLSRPETPISKIEIFVDNSSVPIYSGPLNKQRQDVCNVYPNALNCPYVGFEVIWNTAAVSNGQHTLRFVAYDSDADPNNCNPSPKSTTVTRTVNIQNGRIWGRVWQDSNHNGIYDNGEKYITNGNEGGVCRNVGTPLFIYLKNIDSGETTAVSWNCNSTTGSKYDTYIKPGTYDVSITIPKNPPDADGWMVTAPVITYGGIVENNELKNLSQSYRITIGSQETKEVSFGLQNPAGLLGRVWRDDDGDGIKDDNEPWIISQSSLVDTNSCPSVSGGYDKSQDVHIIASSLGSQPSYKLPIDRCDGSGGFYAYNIFPGKYNVTIEKPSGWEITTPNPINIDKTDTNDENSNVWFGIRPSPASACPSEPTSYPTDSWDRVWCNKDFTTKLADSPDESVEQFFNNWGTDVVAGIRADDIGFRSGRTINFPVSGTYTFTVGSDDGVRVWIDGELVLDKWVDRGYTKDTFTKSLTAGNHIVRIDYYENGGAAAVEFRYTAPCSYSISPTSASYGSSGGSGSFSVTTTSSCSWTASSNDSWITITNGSSGSGNGTISYSVASNSGSSSRTGTITVAGQTFTVNQSGSSCISPGSGTGLTGSYYDGTNFNTLVTTRTDATINFSPADSLGVNYANSPDGDTFSVRWQGQVQPRCTETYTFKTNSDDGVRLWVNGVKLIDNWSDHAPTYNTGTISLTAGQKYDITLEYYENAGGATIQLFWSSPSTAEQIIPQTQLYPLSNYTLSVNSAGASAIAITSTTGHGGTTNYTKTITAGTSVNLTAPLTAGSMIFSGWTGCTVSTSQTINITMPSSNTACTANYSTPPPDFSISSSNNLIVTLLGGQSSATSNETTITVSPLNGFNSDVNLSVDTIDPQIQGAVPIFSDNTLSASKYSSGSRFKITIPATTPTGTYTIVIKGVGGGLTRTVTPSLRLNVTVVNPGWEEF